MLQFMESQGVGHDLMTEQKYEKKIKKTIPFAGEKGTTKDEMVGWLH